MIFCLLKITKLQRNTRGEGFFDLIEEEANKRGLKINKVMNFMTTLKFSINGEYMQILRAIWRDECEASMGMPLFFFTIT